MIDTTILTTLGYTDDGEGTWTQAFGAFRVEVQTKEWKWERDDTPYGHSVEFAVDPPRFAVYLPHSCDEWVIVGRDYGQDDQGQVMARWALDASHASTALQVVRAAVLS